MKAIVQDTYGSAEVLRTEDIDKPKIGDDDVLVRVHARSRPATRKGTRSGKGRHHRVTPFRAAIGRARSAATGEWSWRCPRRRKRRGERFQTAPLYPDSEEVG